MSDDDLHILPGRVGDRGSNAYRKARSLAGQVRRAMARSGAAGNYAGSKGPGTGRFGRGRNAALRKRSGAFDRRVLVKARVVRHGGTRFRSAPLGRHIAYLERDGVTRDGDGGRLFDAAGDAADGDAFADRCGEDRHHFRFIVSPEDAADLADMRTFTRELMGDMARDLGTQIDWVAIDHWNTGHPHVHVLLRGVDARGADLVIDRNYIGTGLRARAQERVTTELGPRSERDLRAALRREIHAERWTGLDSRLARLAADTGYIDLRTENAPSVRRDRTFLIGRARVLEKMGLAERVGPASWSLDPQARTTLRELGDRVDIVRTMHRALAQERGRPADARFQIHDRTNRPPVVGRLVERGLHDELTGEAYAVVEALDGAVHHIRFPDIEATGDGSPGAVVEATDWTDRTGRARRSLAVRSDLPLERQIDAPGATWLDRRLLGPQADRQRAATASGFGAEVSAALEQRSAVLAERGLARRQGARLVFADRLLETLRREELNDTAEILSSREGVPVSVGRNGDHVAGIYRDRLTLSSGRVAVIENGAGLQLVPWRRDLEMRKGETVHGRITPSGQVDWSFAQKRGPAI